MRTRLYSVDNDRFYASVSFIPDDTDNISNEELIKNINSKIKDKKVDKYNGRKWTNPEPEVNDYVSPWGPQYKVNPNLYTGCEHEIVPATEGFACTKCYDYFPSNLEKVTNVYQVGDENDWYTAEGHNPELISTSFHARHDNIDYYDTYDGLLPEVNEDHEEHEKMSYIEDVNNDSLDGAHVSESAITEISEDAKEFSKELTEMCPDEIKFWNKMCSYVKGEFWIKGKKVEKEQFESIIKTLDREWFTEEDRSWCLEALDVGDILDDDGKRILSHKQWNRLCCIMRYCHKWKTAIYEGVDKDKTPWYNVIYGRNGQFIAKEQMISIWTWLVFERKIPLQLEYKPIVTKINWDLKLDIRKEISTKYVGENMYTITFTINGVKRSYWRVGKTFEDGKRQWVRKIGPVLDDETLDKVLEEAYASKRK